jgi:hypothetical protein
MRQNWGRLLGGSSLNTKTSRILHKFHQVVRYSSFEIIGFTNSFDKSSTVKIVCESYHFLLNPINPNSNYSKAAPKTPAESPNLGFKNKVFKVGLKTYFTASATPSV